MKTSGVQVKNGTNGKSRSARQYPCESCPLRDKDIFRKFSGSELDFVQVFKTGELLVEAQSTILREGASSAHLYTVLSGLAFRYKTLTDGSRQILNFVFPGELIGLQAAVQSEMQHSVESLTDMVLCVFQRERLWELYQKFPSLAFDITWLASREERLLDEHLLNVGRRPAVERLAFLFLHIHRRAEAVGVANGDGNLNMPLTQQQVADALGLSLVHTNKSLRKLYDRKLIAWQTRGVQILDRKGLEELADWEEEESRLRPLI